MLIKLTILLATTFLNGLVIVNASDILSNIELQDLFRIETELIGQFEKYEEHLTKKLELMRLVVGDLRSEHQKTLNDPVSYLWNPLNSFALIRRMHDDWVKWHDFVQDQEAKQQIEFIEALTAMIPKEEGIIEAAINSILHIKDIYEMSADEIANGILNGQQYDARLTALDCYFIGDYLKSESEFHASVEWFNVSQKLYTPDDDRLSVVLEFDEAKIWYSLWDAFFSTYQDNEAYEAIQRAVQLQPNEQLFLDSETNLRDDLNIYRLCRNELTQKLSLHCRYNSMTTPFLKLAPLKMEEIALDPYMVLYHDIIYDNEILELKRIAHPTLSRGEVSRGGVDPSRTSQAEGVSPKSSDKFPAIFQRIDDMTGLDWSIIPYMDVTNYGLGGEYYKHTDYVNLTLNPDMAGNNGDRIASILIYLTDVEKGGGTAFPLINTVVQPRKGTALFFYHLDNAGNPNPKSIHAGCPVLLGSKWTIARYTFYWPQMLKKPCYEEGK